MRREKFFAAVEAYNNDRGAAAIQLMEECAREDDPVACYLLALWLSQGEGGKREPEKASRWINRLKELAESGNAEAQWELSGKYRWGDLMDTDLNCANRWLEESANNGFGEAQHHLAWYYEFGQYGYAKDLEMADRWYARAYAQEHPETLYYYALKYFIDGKTTEKSIDLLTKASDKGFKQADEMLRNFIH